MVNRALSLAAVTLLIGGFAVAPAVAQNQNLEAGKLLVGLPNLLLEVIVTVAQQIGFALQGIVVGNLQGHSRVAASHAEEAEHDKTEHAERTVKKTMRHVNAPEASVKRVRQNNDEIILLQIPSP